MRMIDKLPKTPNLNEKLVRMITGLLFLKNIGIGRPEYYGYDPKILLQIMGNIAFLNDMFIDNTQLNLSAQPSLPNLLISGGINPAYKENTEETNLVKMLYTEGGKKDWNDVLTIPEAEIINNKLKTMKYNPWEKSVLLETESTNLKENITKSRDAGFYDGVMQLRLFTTKENSLRAVATARKHLPNLEDLASISYTPTIPQMGIKVDEENWAKHPLSQQYVYGEFLRVVKYSEEKDILLTDTEQTQLNAIINEFALNSK